MKAKKLLSMLAMLFCMVTFSACDKEGSGLLGLYATPSEYSKDFKQDFRKFIIVGKDMVTYYNVWAVHSSNYYGSGSIKVPGAPGWYVEANSERTAAYFMNGGKLILENGEIYVIDGNDLVKTGERYSKF